MPHKTCTLDCVYCECGATTHLTLRRKEYVSVDRVMAELHRYLSHNEKIDYITFSGSGEPTLNDGIGEIIQFLKSDYPEFKVAVLTNSTLFDQRSVREQVKNADVVMASLDAGTDDRFRQINRPHPQLDLKGIVDGVSAFGKMFDGRLILEYFAVRNVNDSDDDLYRLKEILRRIDSKGIVVNTLDRPGTQGWVRPVESNRLRIISEFLGNAEVVKYPSCNQPVGERRHGDLMARLVDTVRRRPYTARDVSQIMGLDVETVKPMLDRLVASNRLVSKRMDRGLFYLAA
ncbi:radical SAM protein [Desulfosarcina widdelii]|uniref:radical SAM protein n=1 Tax=Desulfosarcina widdelii TaxID=947919 RepID=UPI00147863AB|nr:radical SAM protein [Desulfosarcina widdelii]